MYKDNLSGICSYCLKLFGNGVNKQEAGLVNMPKPALRRMAIIVGCKINITDWINHPIRR